MSFSIIRTFLLFVLDASCPICQNKVSQYYLCETCLRELGNSECLDWSIDRFSSLFFSHEVRSLLHSIKYEGRYEYLTLFEPYLPNQLPWQLCKKTVVVPIPLSFKRFTKRGFNQSEWFARAVAKKLGLEMNSRGLVKIKETLPQSKLDGSARKTNLENAFEWCSKRPIPEKILLVDDVLTTGQTLKECARTLKKAGAKEVKCWTLAKAKPEFT